MPAHCEDRLADVTRHDLVWIVPFAGILLGPSLAAVYAIGQWVWPGIGPSWTDGLVQGVLAPPLVATALAVRRRRIRRRSCASPRRAGES